ncbi:MAG TPA: hypothetical protein VL966_18750 [Alphaproteobacteria bacterium]|nr:hypothetical protein [Alphaproteobacteria bacterium]
MDATGWTWKLNHPVNSDTLNFRRLGIESTSLLASVARFVADLIKVTSNDNLRGTFEALCQLMQSPHFREIDRAGGALGETLISDLRRIPEFLEYRLHYVRSWYCWCADQGMEQFPEAFATRIRALSIPGNETGRAVRTQDPVEGAFDDIEFMAITTRLTELGPERLTTLENALCWLAVACGANPLTYALVREEDYKPLQEEETGRIHALLDLPRIKKGDVLYRQQFHPRMLNDEIGAWVTRLVMENRAHREQQGWPDGCAYPLFRRFDPDPDRVNGPYHAYAMHMAPSDITKTIQRAIAKLGIISHRTGEPLVVTMRRFRRTFATRAVEAGATPVELAVMLDHSDLGTVMAYFEGRVSQVLRLDAATAMQLGPIAQAFLGKIVRSEREAANGGDPAKRIPWFNRHPDRDPQRAGNVGTCGSSSGCDLYAPLSCYTCKKFQPWRDGPHRQVLDFLCGERERKRKEGLDEQMVRSEDATILAIGEVVKACEAAQP